MALTMAILPAKQTAAEIIRSKGKYKDNLRRQKMKK